MRWATLFVGMLTLTACDRRAPEWTAWVYPDRSDLTYSVSMNGFRSFKQCQEAAIGRLRSLPDPDAGDFECGYKCAWRQEWNTNVCKETRK